MSIFIRFAIVASQVCEITPNFEKIRTCSTSRSSKIIDLGANRKRICNFLLVINSNFGLILYRFRDIDAWLFSRWQRCSARWADRCALSFKFFGSRPWPFGGHVTSSFSDHWTRSMSILLALISTNRLLHTAVEIWCHKDFGVTWRHRSRYHRTILFPIGGPLKP